MKHAVPLVAIVITLTAVKTAAIELRQEPLQRQLQQTLLAAGGSWQDDDPAGNDRLEGRGRRPGEKSVARAALYSLLLPGLGEYYVGHKQKARVFFTVEALGWAGLIGFRVYSNWKEDDYRRFAAERANADLEGKDDWFADMVGFYDDIDQYNSFGRVFDPERPYLEDNASNHWRWQTRSDRAIYRHLKNKSREADRRAEFMIGLLVVNRIVSVIDAVRDAKRSQRRLDRSFGRIGPLDYRVDVDPFSKGGHVGVAVLTRF